MLGITRWNAVDDVFTLQRPRDGIAEQFLNHRPFPGADLAPGNVAATGPP